MAEIKAKAGQRVPTIRRAFSSIPMDYVFSVSAAQPGETLSGKVEIRKSRWILPGAWTTVPLLEKNVVSAGFWNTFMSVDVVPDVDAVISTGGRGIRHLWVILLLAVLIIAMAGAMFFVTSG